MLQAAYSFEELKMSSQLVRDLISRDEKVKPLVNQFYSLDNIQNQIDQKTFSKEKRRVLKDALQTQNKTLKLSEKTKLNIELLAEENSFTVTTGHQLNLMSGPLYMLYKVSQCISLAESLNARNPEQKFVPIFWMATEDHDFAEINFFHLFGQKFQWDNTKQEGCVAGRIKTEGMGEFLERIEAKFQDPKALEVVQRFTHFYRVSTNLAEATRALLNELFGEFGLVILDGDDVSLKAEFKSVMKSELESAVGYTEVMKTNKVLEDNAYHEQVFVRHSNLFYIAEDGTRLRIRKEDGIFYLEDEVKELSDLLEELEKNPERFSPNALYRPLYQECVLPNLVYIGGGGEIAYWLQIKGLFEAHQLTFPMLLLRDSILLYTAQQLKLMQENNLELMDLKLGVDQIVKEVALSEAEEEIKLSEARSKLDEIQKEVKGKVEVIDSGLGGMVEAEFVKMQKSLEKIESKLMKAEKAKHEQLQKKLEKLHNQFFPDGGFQERHDNFISYYLKDENFITKLLNTLKSGDTPQIHTVQI